MIPSSSVKPIRATPSTTPALVASRVIDTTRVFTVKAVNTNGSTRYIQLFDLAALPADTAVPFAVLALATNTAGEITYPNGRVLKNGLVVCNSSTLGTKTIGSADSLIDVTHD